ncbi:MAG: hypothetical protein ACR2HN_09075 [Tepidiformaceae bacterium]
MTPRRVSMADIQRQWEEARMDLELIRDGYLRGLTAVASQEATLERLYESLTGEAAPDFRRRGAS